MAVAIRLRRTGAKKRPFYRIVVADVTRPRSGKYIDSVGYYNPVSDPVQLEVDTDKAIDWLGKGAKPTDFNINGKANTHQLTAIFSPFDLFGP